MVKLVINCVFNNLWSCPFRELQHYRVLMRDMALIRVISLVMFITNQEAESSQTGEQADFDGRRFDEKRVTWGLQRSHRQLAR